MILSIITVNYNNAKGLERTLKSVHNQTFKDFEHLVIDGNSTDGSKKVIEEYSNYLTYWVSEPDSGIYDAMNKGIKLASGEYLYFLNSGDVLYEENILQKIFENLQFDTDIIYGDVMLKYHDKKLKCTYPKTLRFSYFFNTTICHQAVFLNTTLFSQNGLYNIKNSIVADWEFLIKSLFISNATYQKINVIVSEYDMSGISNQDENRSKIYQDRMKVLKRYFPAFIDDYIYMRENELKISKINRILGSHFFFRLDNPLFRNSIKFSARLFNRIYRVKYDVMKGFN